MEDSSEDVICGSIARNDTTDRRCGEEHKKCSQ